MAYNIDLEQARLRMRLRNYAFKQYDELAARIKVEYDTATPEEKVAFDEAKAEILALTGSVADLALEPETVV